jgi:AcrR family transcriptional regulator
VKVASGRRGNPSLDARVAFSDRIQEEEARQMSLSQSLPRGRHSIPREIVVDNQRTRLLDGVAGALQERCYGDLAVAHITGEAGVSRATFYVIFESKRECVRVAHERAFERLTDRIGQACAGLYEWGDKLAAGLGAGLRFAVESPQEARLLILESMGADTILVDRVIASHDELASLLRVGRKHRPSAAGLPEVTERGLIGAVTSVVADFLMAGKAADLIELEPQLLEFMLMPYRPGQESKAS